MKRLSYWSPPRSDLLWFNAACTQRRFVSDNPGATQFKWTYENSYVRSDAQRLFHYPPVSTIINKPIDWRNSTPLNGYEGLSVYGNNTLELKGIPMGRTPEYMQERLRRYFSKFGVVMKCRCIPHPLDAYQCEGTAYVAFKDLKDCFNAISMPLKFPASLHDKIIHMRILDTDKTNNVNYINEHVHYNKQLVRIARQLHEKLQAQEYVVLKHVWKDIHEFDINGASRAADESVVKLFGTWLKFLSFSPFDKLFHISNLQKDDQLKYDSDFEETGLIHAKLLCRVEREKILYQASIQLHLRLARFLSPYWRTGRPPLPRNTLQQISAFDYPRSLPERLQWQSRTRDLYRIYDEKHIIRYRMKCERNALKKVFKKEKRLRAKKTNPNITR